MSQEFAATDRFSLLTDTVDLWYFRLQTEHADALLLTSDEIARADRFHLPSHRDRFVAARATSVEFSQAISGVRRPNSNSGMALGASPLCPVKSSFSLSHTDDRAAVAVARFALGIDIERCRPIAEGVAEHCFAPDELEALSSMPPTERECGFFACWTRKEAFIKAKGTGLSEPLDGFCVGLNATGQASVLRVGDHPTEHLRWQLADIETEPGIAGAIAARRCGWSIRRQT